METAHPGTAVGTEATTQLKALLSRINPVVLDDLMPRAAGVITMMFTDIVDSTRVKAELGDQRYLEEILKPHNALVLEKASHHEGLVIKSIGDAFFVAFALPDKGVACALDIQKTLLASPIGHAPLQVRIGIHTGTPICLTDPVSKTLDLSGTDVDKAARIEALAPFFAGQSPAN